MTVIEFKNVTKHFKIYQNKSYSIKEKFLNKVLRRNKLQVTTMNVLKNASYKINKGETVGIIGENGTGKSTSLKLISNILKPNEGEVIVKGKISSLLEIGVGFQPDMTGRENVYLYGSILGLKKEEIDKKYNDIVKFSELESFMDTPVKNYSSGMYMRLAFSVAVSVDPDILLVDEVLAVGDANFQKKCIDKIMSFKEEGKTIVFVSHDMSTVRKICDKVIFIKKGGYVLEGSPERMIGLYMRLFYSDTEDRETINKLIEDNNLQDDIHEFNLELHEAKEYSSGNRMGSRELEVTKVYFSDDAGRPRNFYGNEEQIKVNVEFRRNNKDIPSAIFAFEIYSEEGWKLSYHDCKQDGLIITDIKDLNMISFTIKNNPFLMSKYYLSTILYDEDREKIYDYRDKHYFFTIHEDNIKQEGKIVVECDWQL